MFRKTARDESGVVTGNGEDIAGIWLEKASEGLGSPVPSQIADKLRGKEFSNFDAFRKAFWLSIAENEELMSQFKGASKAHIRKGNAPFAPKNEHYGKIRKFEIHHVNEIQHGGAVYDIDNLRVVTPRIIKKYIKIKVLDMKRKGQFLTIPRENFTFYERYI